MSKRVHRRNSKSLTVIGKETRHKAILKDEFPSAKLTKKEGMVHTMLTPTEEENEQLVLLYERKNQNIIKFIQNSNKDDTIITKIEEYKGADQSITDIHTHPNSTPFSPNDFWLYLKVPSIYKGQCLTPKGVIFIATKTKRTPDADSITREDFDNNWEQSKIEADKIMDAISPTEYPKNAFNDAYLAHFIIADRIMAKKYNLKWGETDKASIFST